MPSQSDGFFEEHDYDGIQRAGVYDAYYQTFLLLVRTEIEGRCGYWELGNNLILPTCMREGSLEEAYEMMGVFEDDLTFEYFMGRRVVDVQRHLDRIHGVFRGKCGPGEKIVVKKESPF